MPGRVVLIKASGEKELYSPSKVKRALTHSGLFDEGAESFLKRLEPKLYAGITTREIYKIVYQTLDKATAARFSLKQSLMKIGSGGHDFETFIASCLKQLKTALWLVKNTGRNEAVRLEASRIGGLREILPGDSDQDG